MMRHRISCSRPGVSFLVLIAVIVISTTAASAWCQELSSASLQDQQADGGSPSYSTPEAGTPTLNTLNQNANSIQYTDRDRVMAPLHFAVEAAGAWTNNLLNALNSQDAQSASYFTLGVPVSLQLSSQRTSFQAYVRMDSNFYPSYPDLNHTSEVYSHQLTHQMSETTSMSWSLAGGRIVELGNYLPPVIAIGSTGVALPVQSGGLQPLYNAASTYAISHQLSMRDAVTASATAGWLDEPEGSLSIGGKAFQNRQWTGGGDLHWQRTLNTRESAGVELTNVYIKGISPSGMGNFTTAIITFGQTLTPHLSFIGGAGPLFIRSQQNGSAASNGLSYSANASVTYRSTIGDISGTYSRVYEMSYFLAPTVENRIAMDFDRPLTRAINLTAGFDRILSSAAADGSTVGYSQFGLSARMDFYLGRGISYYVGGTSFNNSSIVSTATYPGYGGDSITYGITYHFGEPARRGGGLQ